DRPDERARAAPHSCGSRQPAPAARVARCRRGRCRDPRRAQRAAGWRTPIRSMTVHIDTSALVDALTGPRRSLDVLTRLAEEGNRLSLSAIVLYEWLRGPRTHQDLAAQEDLFPRARAVPFGAEQAARAARLYA